MIKLLSSRTALCALLFCAPAVLTFACNSTPTLGLDNDGTADAGDKDSDSGGGGGADSDSDLDGSIADIDGGGGGGGVGPGGNGKPEICDGIDNNADGAIDNIDVGNDGVCDCIKVATLGVKGTVSNGSDVFESWLEGKSTAGVVDLANETITAADIEDFDVIVAQDLRGHDYSDDEVEILNDWMAAGGGLFTMIGYGSNTEMVHVNEILAATGIEYDNTPILSKSGTYTVPIDEWSASHPIADGITAIGMDNGYQVDGEGTVIAEKDGLIIGRAKEFADGRVFVWGDEWISFNSEWNQDAEAPVEYEVERLWLNALKWLGPRDSCQVPIPDSVK